METEAEVLNANVPLTRARGCLRTCRKCGGASGRLMTTPTIHVGLIRCNACNVFCSWVPQNVFARLVQGAR